VSTALYNHKAIYLSGQGLIAFLPKRLRYLHLFDETGFSRRATISALQWSGDSRGLYIGDNAYIVDNSSVSVLDMTGFTMLLRLSY
jgi:uncharacterized secreted protein with C-terminal beta-propeller domain